MSADRDMTRIVRSWLRTDEHESADRVLDNVLALLDATPQRRSWWPARGIADMKRFAKLAIAAAAVVVVAVSGINLVPAIDRMVGGRPMASPSPSPSPTPRASPWPASSEVTIRGDLTVGRHSLTVKSVPFSFTVPKAGWHPFGSLLISKSTVGPEDAEAVIFWTSFPDGVFADPCGILGGPGLSAAGLAASVSVAPGTEIVAGPSDVTVGGSAAKHVVVTVREDLGCDPGYFYSWEPQTGGPLWVTTDVGDTIRVWTLDVEGTRLFIEGETNKKAGAGLEQEIQQIVDSIVFE